MRLERLDVISCSGSKGEERPVTFILRGRRIDVAEIAEQWIEDEREDRVRRRFFLVTGNDGSSHRVCYEESEGEWYYAS